MFSDQNLGHRLASCRPHAAGSPSARPARACSRHHVATSFSPSLPRPSPPAGRSAPRPFPFLHVVLCLSAWQTGCVLISERACYVCPHSARWPCNQVMQHATTHCKSEPDNDLRQGATTTPYCCLLLPPLLPPLRLLHLDSAHAAPRIFILQNDQTHATSRNSHTSEVQSCRSTCVMHMSRHLMSLAIP